MVGLLVLLLLLAAPACAQDGCDYARVDAHALAAPESATVSVASLASYLTRDAHCDREKARAIYRWIADNITYDPSLLGRDPDPRLVLQRRRAVCAGYATLFKALAEAAGLETEIIHGEAKGAGPEGALTADGLLTHDWNAVRLDGHWRLVDCTWGAGRLDDRLRFVPRFSDHYFLTPPELFVFDHYPNESRWQLCDPPLSRSDFVARVTVKPAFFEHNLRLDSNPRARLETDGLVTLTVGAPDDALVVASLSRNGRDLDETRAFAQREGDHFAIRASLPASGRYLLRVFARKRDASTEEYDLAAEYDVIARAGDQLVFPKMFVSFQERDCRLDRPQAGLLHTGLEQFSLRAPGAEDVVVEVNGVATRLAPAGEAFLGSVHLTPGRATVFARFPGHTRHEGLLRYVVE